MNMVQTSVSGKDKNIMGIEDDDRPISTYDNLLNLLQPVVHPSNTNTANSISMYPEASKPIQLQYHPTDCQRQQLRAIDNNKQSLCQPHHHHKHQQFSNAEYLAVNEGGRAVFDAVIDDSAKYLNDGVTESFRVNSKSPDQLSTAQQLVSDTVISTTTTAEGTAAISTKPSLLPQNSTQKFPIKVNEITTASASPALAAQSSLSTADKQLAVRPLSSQIATELNDTSHSIALVKAALNEAKSKFFGLASYQEQQQHMANADSDFGYNDAYANGIVDNIDPNQQQYINNESLKLLPLDSHRAITIQERSKPQPKYQNIPENSALFRNHSNSTTSAQPPDHSDNNCNTTVITTTMTTTTFTSTVNTIENIQPSQAVYMTTTVPQNIKGSKIAGRHTPTRSSLRHSRMLVVNNKTFQKNPSPNPMNFQHPLLARCLLILQLIIGMILAAVSTWQFLLAPNTSTQDNSYWSAITLLITSVLGLNLICYRRMKRNKLREHTFVFLRSASYIFSVLVVILCAIALLIAAIHYSRLTGPNTKCESMNILMENGSCVCTFNTQPTQNLHNNNTTITDSNAPNGNGDDEDNKALQTTSILHHSDLNSNRMEYHDLSCQEVTGAWTTILNLLIVFNSLGFLVSVLFVILLSCYRHSSRELYTSVQTNTFANFT